MRKLTLLTFILSVATICLFFGNFKDYSFLKFSFNELSFATPSKELIRPKIKNIVLITLCTLRLDHMSYSGYIKKTTPFLDWLAENSVVFGNARTIIPLTGPAHASIFTSLYPMQHRMMNNYEKLDDSFLTIAEILKNNGFKTAAFVSNGHLANSNVKQGFDEFSAPQGKGRPSSMTLDLAKKWLNENYSDSFFLWTHLNDPHLPYIASDDFIQSSFSKNPQKEKFLNFLINKQGLNLNLFYNKKESATNAISLYDSEIISLDANLKSFFDYIKGKGINSETLWIVVGDHGEGLGSHNYYEHGGRIYEEQLRIPFYLYLPALLHHKIINKVAENIDVFPTLFDLLSIPVNNNKYFIEGKSLAPLIFDGEYEYRDKDYSFSCTPAATKKVKDKNIDYYWKGVEVDRTKYLPKNQICSIQNNKFKYILNSDGSNEFYNLKKDPLEKNNLIDISSAEKDEMKKILLNKLIQFSNQNKLIKSRIVDEKYFKILEQEGYMR